VEDERLKLLRKYGEIRAVRFSSDENATETHSFVIEGIDTRQTKHLLELLDALDREVGA
jgi:hypothetical protein